MNAKTLYASTLVVALLASGAAMASEATQDNAPAASRSRADVKAELAVARANGELDQRGDSYGQFTGSVKSTLTRAEVRAELARAKASGEYQVPTGLYGSFEAPVTSVRTREEVRAEARAATRARLNASPSYGG